MSYDYDYDLDYDMDLDLDPGIDIDPDVAFDESPELSDLIDLQDDFTIEEIDVDLGLDSSTDVGLESAEEVYDSEFSEDTSDLESSLLALHDAGYRTNDDFANDFLEEEEEEIDDSNEDTDKTDKVEFKLQDSPPQLKEETNYDDRINNRDSFLPRYNYTDGSKEQQFKEIDSGVDWQKEADPENRFPVRLPRDPSDLLIGGHSSSKQIITPEVHDLYAQVVRDSARSGLRSVAEGVRLMFRLVEAGIKSVSWLTDQLNSVLDDSISDNRIREYERLLEMHHRLQEKFQRR